MYVCIYIHIYVCMYKCFQMQSPREVQMTCYMCVCVCVCVCACVCLSDQITYYTAVGACRCRYNLQGRYRLHSIFFLHFFFCRCRHALQGRYWLQMYLRCNLQGASLHAVIICRRLHSLIICKRDIDYRASRLQATKLYLLVAGREGWVHGGLVLQYCILCATITHSELHFLILHILHATVRMPHVVCG
jgi:hypothetical protein